MPHRLRDRFDPAAVMAAVTTLLTVLKDYGHDGLEIEWRMGSRFDGHFRAGISQEAWLKVCRKVESIANIKKSACSTIEHSMSDGCTKKIVDSTGVETWMTKYKLAHLDEATCRLAIAKESVLDGPPHTEQALRVAHTRHKERLSFFYKIWRIDLTKVTSNDAAHVDEDSETYELELEIWDTTALFSYTVEYLCEWAVDLMRQLAATE